MEICADSVASSIAAEKGGAIRVELCDNLLEGGTTPSYGMIKIVRSHVRIKVNVIIRPRGGDFLYSEDEEDIKACKTLGVDGVVLGILSPDGTIDRQRTKLLVDLARPMSVTFHRAFDMTPNPFHALEICCQLGIDRILTSGQEATALEGVTLLAELQRQAGDRLIIMPGAGINPSNIREIVSRTGVKECHASGRDTFVSQMVFRPTKSIFMGGQKINDSDTEFVVKRATPERIRAFCQGLQEATTIDLKISDRAT